MSVKLNCVYAYLHYMALLFCVAITSFMQQCNLQSVIHDLENLRVAATGKTYGILDLETTVMFTQEHLCFSPVGFLTLIVISGLLIMLYHLVTTQYQQPYIPVPVNHSVDNQFVLGLDQARPDGNIQMSVKYSAKLRQTGAKADVKKWDLRQHIKVVVQYLMSVSQSQHNEWLYTWQHCLLINSYEQLLPIISNCILLHVDGVHH